MKLNILLVTYKQEHYIRYTLDSIALQETNFDFNIIVADDCSPDATLAIIEEYATKSSLNFLFLAKSPNLGFVKNYQRAFAACDGEYVAILEGDDYWTSPLHLQNHVDFLDQHSECSMSYNRHERFFEDQDRTEIFDWTASEDFEYISSQCLALGNCIGNFSCCVYRGTRIREIDPRLFDMEIADWMIGMYMGQYGDLAYLKEVTSLYRIHDKGQWSRMSEQEQAQTVILAIDRYDAFLEYKLQKEFAQHKKRLLRGLYGDKSLKGRLKNILPSSLWNWMRKLKTKNK